MTLKPSKYYLHVVAMQTVLYIYTCTVASFAISPVINSSEHKLKRIHVLYIIQLQTRLSGHPALDFGSVCTCICIHINPNIRQLADQLSMQYEVRKKTCIANTVRGMLSFQQ